MIEITLPSQGMEFVWGAGALLLVFVLLFVLWLLFRGGGGSSTKLRNLVKHEWTSINELAQRGDENSLQLAVVRADKLLDHILKLKRYAGSTLGERLKTACARDSKLKEVWWAHKVRNTIVHEPGSQDPREFIRALHEFERAYRRLGAL